MAAMNNTDKQILRRRLILKRKALDRSIKQKTDDEIFKNASGLKQFLSAKAVLIYVSSDIEVSTAKLIDYSFALGKTVAVPKCLDGAGKMVFKKISSAADLIPGMFGIYEPGDACPDFNSFDKSVCFVPALAFDRSGYRLGYGKGYYDRFLKNYPGTTIGLCYSDFTVDVLPINRYDINVNFVVTENGAAEKTAAPERAF